MSWIQKLYDTYENNSHMAGKMVVGQAPLAPVAHIVANAQVEITISEEGDFISAIEVSKDERSTFIPVTEESGGRASGVAPHPLCDTLSYVAGDYSQYIEEGTKTYRVTKEKNKAFMEQLNLWANSVYSHLKVRAINKYCEKNTIIKDLINSGLVQVDDKNRLTSGKISGNPYEKCLVRWRVFSKDEQSATWEDITLFDSYIGFIADIYKTQEEKLCYVTGEKVVLAKNHPKGIISANYGAKLLSANDMSGFTFRGRFIDSDEAYGVGYFVSQKAHNALRWLVANQGVYYGGRTFLCWNPQGKKVPFLQKSILDDEDDDEKEDNFEMVPNTMPIYRKRFIEAINGYRNDFVESDDIIIMALDAATTGRLSITYYNEFKAMNFLNCLEKWYESCCWYFTNFTIDHKPYQVIKTPDIKQLIRCAFGVERANYLEVDDRIMKQQVERIVHCIFDGAPIQDDIVKSAVNNASNPQCYSKSNRERILSVACSLLHKKYHCKESEDNKMNLNQDESNRSYLFGRLLAIAEKVERRASPDVERETNALRMQSAFQQYPMHTWRVLQESLIPYYARLDEKSKWYYKDLTSDVISKFREEDVARMNMSLDDIYLFGYYLQRKELNTYQKKEKESKEDK